MNLDINKVRRQYQEKCTEHSDPYECFCNQNRTAGEYFEEMLVALERIWKLADHYEQILDITTALQIRRCFAVGLCSAREKNDA